MARQEAPEGIVRRGELRPERHRLAVRLLRLRQLADGFVGATQLQLGAGLAGSQAHGLFQARERRLRLAHGDQQAPEVLMERGRFGMALQRRRECVHGGLGLARPPERLAEERERGEVAGAEVARARELARRVHDTLLTEEGAAVAGMHAGC